MVLTSDYYCDRIMDWYLTHCKILTSNACDKYGHRIPSSNEPLITNSYMVCPSTGRDVKEILPAIKNQWIKIRKLLPVYLQETRNKTKYSRNYVITGVIMTNNTTVLLKRGFWQPYSLSMFYIANIMFWNGSISGLLYEELHNIWK